ncbi:MAG: hypothetical protein ACI4D3_07340 [Lachnospiraceae bacterium]
MPDLPVFKNQTSLNHHHMPDDRPASSGFSASDDQISEAPGQDVDYVPDANSPNLQAHTGVYVSSSDKYEDLNSSASSLLIIGLVLAVLLVIDLSRIIRLPIGNSSRILTDSVLGVLAGACLMGSHATCKRANEIKAMIASEQKQRRQIISWCTSTYSAPQIDKMIDAAEAGLPDSMEILSLKRMDMIRCYLIREYHIDDELYLEDLCEEIFQNIFGL